MKEEIKAGIIIVSAFVVLSGFVILIGGSRFFDKYDTYYVRVMNAAGLEAGSQVKLGGVRIGRVLDIKEPVEPGKPVTIEIGLRGGTPIYMGTKALITQVGFVGDIYLLLTVEKAEGERMRPGQDIPSEDTIDFTQIMARLNRLSESVDGLVHDVDKLFSPKNVREIERLLDNTNKTMVSGAQNIEKVAVVIKATADKLELVLNEINGLVKTSKGDVSDLIKKAKDDLERAGEMIRAIEATAKTVDKASGSVDRAVMTQSRNLDILLNTMTRTTEDLQEVLQDLKSKPWSLIYREGKGE
ncbi:MAG: MCE family protein [Nitrospirae bacterium]|nr:MCE family protein [Nitrospirota bacterium]